MRPQLLYAAVATAGVAVLADGRSNNMAGSRCACRGLVRADRRPREGLAYWAAAMVVFAAEWLWVPPDPGWGAWMAGVTLTAGLRRWSGTTSLLGQLATPKPTSPNVPGQERNRIARELHDAIGHSLTVSLLHSRVPGWRSSTTRPSPGGP